MSKRHRVSTPTGSTPASTSRSPGDGVLGNRRIGFLAVDHYAAEVIAASAAGADVSGRARRIVGDDRDVLGCTLRGSHAGLDFVELQALVTNVTPSLHAAV